MKIETKNKKFEPVVITLESQVEINAIVDYVGKGDVVEKDSIVHKFFIGLRKFTDL